MRKPIPQEIAQKLKESSMVWLEESGGYEGTRYRAREVKITHITDEAMFFHGCSGRAWSHYNRSICGWRLWLREPTDKERANAQWGKTIF